ncbi:response regulator transcription factor [Maribacter sp. ACAM166]|uniref:response regulator n=1 Tax=Maribacter sp. ACAM166 TaxID=2508996 RepID=UPI0010FF4B13|nr:response regulator transcription factor [Maribacter sp. ACAM166]TLP80120.1 response regulator transcription factor [Maribacter sp. ACAM166]
MILKILLVDDHQIIRQGLKNIIDDNFAQVQYGEAGNTPEALKLAIEQPWDIILMDINMPGRNGLEAIKELKRNGIKTPILVLSVYPEDQFALRVVKAGAAGYLTKNTTPTLLVKAIKTILDGKQYITEAMTRILISHVSKKDQKNGHFTLSNRELEVLQLIGKGLSVSQIGDELSLSVKTISTFRSHILVKMNMKSNADMILYAIKNDLVD